MVFGEEGDEGKKKLFMKLDVMNLRTYISKSRCYTSVFDKILVIHFFWTAFYWE